MCHVHCQYHRSYRIQLNKKKKRKKWTKTYNVLRVLFVLLNFCHAFFMQFSQIFETLSMSIRIMSLGKFECTAVKWMCQPRKAKILGKSNENTRRNPIIKLGSLTHINTHDMYKCTRTHMHTNRIQPIRSGAICLVVQQQGNYIYCIKTEQKKRNKKKLCKPRISNPWPPWLTWNAYTDGMVFNVCVFWMRKISSFSRPMCGIASMDVFEKSLFKIA